MFDYPPLRQDEVLLYKIDKMFDYLPLRQDEVLLYKIEKMFDCPLSKKSRGLYTEKTLGSQRKTLSLYSGADNPSHFTPPLRKVFAKRYKIFLEIFYKFLDTVGGRCYN